MAVPARKIIVLDVDKTADAVTVKAALWLAVPVNRIRLAPGAQSHVPSALLQAGDLEALQAGEIIESIVSTGQIPTAPSGSFNARVRNELEALYNAAQALVTANDAGTRYIGASWNGTTWSMP